MKSKNLARKVSCTLAMGTFLVSGQALAADLSFELEQIVVTAARTEQTVADTAANVEVITTAEIEQGQYRNVGEAIEHETGINVVSHGYPGAPASVYINGSDKVVVLVDGRRMNQPNGVGYGSNTFDLSNITAMGNIERIEVVKGGASAIYGADAVGGVINIITKKGEANKTTLNVGGGNWGQERYALTNEGRDGEFGWFIAAQKERSGNIEDGNGEKLLNTGYDSESYTLRLDRALSDKADLSFGYENFRSDSGMLNVDKDHVEQENWDLTYHVATSDNTNNTVKIYQNNSDRSGLMSGDKFYHYATVDGFDYQISSQLNDQHLLTAGYEYRKDKLDSLVYGGRDNVNQALFAQDQWQLTDKLALTTGVRVDDNETYGDEATPHLALNYKESDKTNYYATWGRVFRAPRFDDLYWPEEGSIEEGWTIKGNPNLKPETGWSAEIGVNHEFDDTLNGKLSVFRRELNDAIDWDTNLENGVYNTIVSNVNQEKTTGLEIQLTKQLSPKFRTFAGYNYLDIQQNKDNAGFERDDNTPTDTWNVGLGYTAEKVNAELRGTAVLGRPNPDFNEKSYWVWNANMQVQLSENYEAFLTVNNIFDKNYEEVAPTWGQNRFNSPGRNFMLGVKAVF